MRSVRCTEPLTLGSRRLLDIGLIINPIAGMGGSVALRGTDGTDIVARARAAGVTPHAPQRARRALVRLATKPELAMRVHAPVGAMGGEVARQTGHALSPLDGVPPAMTT